MRINTNVPALNTLRWLGKSSTRFTRSVSRLSSGYRINTASDDAAGLGIANTLRARIRELRQVSRNAEQGRALLQVAEGGAGEAQGLLLAVAGRLLGVRRRHLRPRPRLQARGQDLF